MGQTEIEPVLAIGIILIATGLMLAGGLLPSVSIQKLSNSIQHIFQTQQNKTLAESLGLQQTPEVFSQGGGGAIGLSDTHAIGPGPQLSQEVMMYVTVDGYRPPPPPDVTLHTTPLQPDVRYYWRSQTYDVYNGHVWITNTAYTQAMKANSPYHPDLTSLPENYQLVRQHVQRLQSMDGALLVTGDLLSTDQASTAAWRASGDLIDARTNADAFTADSRIQYVTIAQLRLAGNNYPQSIHNYLYLPDELPERVRDLAVHLTINQPTPYDQVMAIQNYLRQFPYSLKVPGAPTNRDVADYFLFDLQKGYCDYFATTMAVMVRAIGIPARLVTGFSSGTYDYNTNRFVVVQANAHSWVEVYFPGIGWVEFEPTTNQLPFPRPGGTTAQNNPTAAIPTPIAVKASGTIWINWKAFRQPIRILEFVLAGLVVLLLLWLLLPVESWLLYLRTTDKAITTIHQRLYRQGRAWGVASDPARTPYEFAESFSSKLERFSRNQRLAPVILSLQADVKGLTKLYTCMLFSPHRLTRDEHHQAVQNWANIRKGLRKIRYS
jgi:transglutaminase-like putative cysteine protease